MNAVSLKRSFDSTKISQKEWIFHFIVWALFIVSFAIPDTWTRIFPDNGITFTLLGIILPIYINAQYLIPRYFKRTRLVKYILLLSLLLLTANALKALLLVHSMEFRGLEYEFVPEFRKWIFRDFRDLEKFIFGGTAMILYFSFTYRIGKDWIVNERVKDQLISEKVSMELALLKSQVNPHFLFNTLNNIYAMALEEKAVRTADGVAKMGTLMRYSLQDAQADLIPLQKEIEYITRYIEMQKLRIIEEGKLTVNLNLADLEMGDEKIAPMILIPFIENAFKYGVSTVKASSVKIDFKLAAGVLFMRLKNNVPSDIRVENGGIGLKNVKNRLNLIYPDKHKLFHGLRENSYIVDLEIDLKK